MYIVSPSFIYTRTNYAGAEIPGLANGRATERCLSERQGPFQESSDLCDTISAQQLMEGLLSQHLLCWCIKLLMCQYAHHLDVPVRTPPSNVFIKGVS